MLGQGGRQGAMLSARAQQALLLVAGVRAEQGLTGSGPLRAAAERATYGVNPACIPGVSPLRWRVVLLGIHNTLPG